MAISFTTVVAVDRQHLEELAVVWPTWRKFKPEIFENPLVVFADAEQLDFDQLEWIGDDHPTWQFVPWRCSGVETQREKMLNAFLAAAWHVGTPWILKIDTDCIATSGGKWIEESWFAEDPLCFRLPAYIASPWSYTRPPSLLDDLDMWAESIKYFDGTPPVDRDIVGNKARHRRAISWLQFIDTSWLRFVHSLCEGSRLPVPSQDTTLCYIAERSSWPVRHVRMSRYGWKHASGLTRLQRIAAEVLA